VPDAIARVDDEADLGSQYQRERADPDDKERP
jgi:hypothetical protein